MLIAPRSCSTSSAAIVSAANPALGERHVLGHVGVEVMAHHQHVEVLVQRVDREGPRRVRRARQHVRLAADLDDVRRVSTARPFGVIRVNRPPLERRDRVVHVAGLVQRVGVDRDLHVEPLRLGQAAVDRRRRRAPVFVQLQPDRPRRICSSRPCGQRRVALSEEPEVHRQACRWPAASARRDALPACTWSRWCPSPDRCRRR